ncbi:hypothetical protein SUDANB121_05483 [Nocardiopsis dassonvillei]|uniref:hypothetical protein n=1 Tax=Nocardiopsis dassonvillei TaxID=2014 RepID=UPI003F55CA19
MLQQHIVEGFWFNDRLYVWAMDAARPAVTGSRHRVPLHPYALPPADLGRCVGGLGSDAPRTAVLHLPGRPRRPAAPPGLLPPGGDLPPDGGLAPPDPPVLRPWSVPVRELGPAAALRLLTGPAGPRTGTGLLHLAALARAAHEHARAGCVVPAVHHEDRARVHWRPVLAPAGLAWLRNAAAAAPPPLRAHRDPDPDPARAGAAVLADLLECLCSLTDAAVRERLAYRFPDGGADLLSAAAPTREWFVRAHRAAAGERPAERSARGRPTGAAVLVEPGGRR